jgi:hypothetical protein
LPENVEMLTCMEDWDQATRKEQHAPEDIDLEELFHNLYVAAAVAVLQLLVLGEHLEKVKHAVLSLHI